MTTPVEDIEIVADLFRLARSGKFTRLEPLLEEAQGLYPAEPAERIRACARQLGEILWDADYQGDRAEFMRRRRRTA